MSIFNIYFSSKKKSTKQRIPGYFFEIFGADSIWIWRKKNIGEAKYLYQKVEESISDGRKISVTINISKESPHLVWPHLVRS